MPSSSWRCWPCESDPTGALKTSARWTSPAISSARSRPGSSAGGRRGSKRPRCTPRIARNRLWATVSPMNSMRGLVGPAEAEPRPPVRRQVGHVLAEELDRARGREVVAGDHVEERRLPGPVRAEDRAALADRDLHGHVAKSLEGAEAPPHALQAQGGGERFGCRRYGHGQLGKSRLTGSAKYGLSSRLEVQRLVDVVDLADDDRRRACRRRPSGSRTRSSARSPGGWSRG